ncbi:MAG: RNA-binding cell elongation regulator Jag/EloR [Acidimicrobiia bacterium]
MEWVEVRASSIDEAVDKALEELSIDLREDAKIEVIEEPSKGFLGMGGKDAVVRVSKVARSRGRRRGRQGRGSGGKGSEGQGRRQGKDQRERGQDQRGGRQGQDRSRDAGSRADRSKEDRSTAGGPKPRGGGNRKQSSGDRSRPQQAKRAKERTMDEAVDEEVDVEAQAEVVGEFLKGLVSSFGLDGTVATRVEEELIIADLTGEQTEALVGPKGAIMQSVGELVRTVVQRKTHRRARLRLDIGGYLERRREALTIYAGRLAEQVLDEGGELMLEPMNPADRKVVHDAVGEIEGVRSFSEGEEPRRSVVISLAPGVEPRGGSGLTEDDEEDSEGSEGAENGEEDSEDED